MNMHQQNVRQHQEMVNLFQIQEMIDRQNREINEFKLMNERARNKSNRTKAVVLGSGLVGAGLVASGVVGPNDVKIKAGEIRDKTNAKIEAFKEKRKAGQSEGKTAFDSDYFKDQIYKEAAFGFGPMSATKALKAANKMKPKVPKIPNVAKGMADMMGGGTHMGAGLDDMMGNINVTPAIKQTVADGAKKYNKTPSGTTGKPYVAKPSKNSDGIINRTLDQRKKMTDMKIEHKQQMNQQKNNYEGQLQAVKDSSKKYGLIGAGGAALGVGGLAYGINEKNKNMNYGIQ